MIRRSARPSSNYLVVSNSVVCDRRISFAAGGLLLHLLSKPDHWEVSPSALAKEAQEGRDKIYKLLGELIGAGYCKRITRRGERGKIVGTDYEISDAPRDADPLPENPDTDLPDTDLPDTDLPDTDLPDTDLPDTDLPYPGLPTQESKDTKKVTNLENNQRESEQGGALAVPQEPTTPSKRGSRLPDDWQLTQEFYDEAAKVRPEVIHQIYDIAASFGDYWKSQSGRQGVRCDWMAVWRNWVRRERFVPPKRPAPQRRTRNLSAVEIATDTNW
ncbi:hypothetical protein Misp06_04019 [Microbulbifer sp. NBRC 101763]|uniref:hypothetical protein n=1 Tax=Microbulbifer sp. NBRC 101763 TaxID=1113820 RepID=UPI0030A98368